MTSFPPDPWVIVARIGKAVGLDGALRVWPEADMAAVFEVAVPLAAYLTREAKLMPLRMETAREDAHGWVVKWEGFDSRESTTLLRNALLVAQRQDLPDPGQDAVYWADLMGARVCSHEGQTLGIVVDLVDSAANSVVEVENEQGRRFLLPLTEEVNAVLEPARSAGEKAVLRINLLEGLEEATEVS